MIVIDNFCRFVVLQKLAFLVNICEMSSDQISKHCFYIEPNYYEI